MSFSDSKSVAIHIAQYTLKCQSLAHELEISYLRPHYILGTSSVLTPMTPAELAVTHFKLSPVASAMRPHILRSRMYAPREQSCLGGAMVDSLVWLMPYTWLNLPLMKAATLPYPECEVMTCTCRRQAGEQSVEGCSLVIFVLMNALLAAFIQLPMHEVCPAQLQRTFPKAAASHRSAHLIVCQRHQPHLSCGGLELEHPVRSARLLTSRPESHVC